MPSRTLDKIDINTRIVPVQKAFSLFTRRSHHRPIHGFRLSMHAALSSIACTPNQAENAMSPLMAVVADLGDGSVATDHRHHALALG
jgi:hypothetical protein